MFEEIMICENYGIGTGRSIKRKGYLGTNKLYASLYHSVD